MGLSMKRGRLPLTALRTFEVAGRLQSFTLAGEELHISQAAISRQVRELEERLGRPLFERRHRSVALTAAGEILQSVLTRTFDEIDVTLEELYANRDASTVTVSVEPSFALAWLVPNLAGFRSEHPGIDIIVDADSRLADFRNSDARLAIRHSAQKAGWPRTESRHLAYVEMTPVISSDRFPDRSILQKPADLLKLPLIHEETRDLWQRWFSAAEVITPVQRGAVYTDGSLVLQATLQGEGVALVDKILAKDHLLSGKLWQPFPLSIPYGAYFIVTRRFSMLPAEAAAFASWLAVSLRS